MSWNDAANWTVCDPAQDLALEDIHPFSARSTALLVRNKRTPRLRQSFVEVFGAVEMLSGLDYHFERFLTLQQQRLRAGFWSDDGQMRHEAVAYLNRLGQFCHFVDSAFVKGINSDLANGIPAIRALMVFRNKHTAHRSIDDPRKEDTDELKFSHARSMTLIGGRFYKPRPGVSQSFPEGPKSNADVEAALRATQIENFVGYAIHQANGPVTYFHPESDHPIVAAEAYKVVEAVILFP